MKQQLANLPRLVQWFALWRPGAPLLLDAFCGAGGAAMGYWRAGFNVIGCDIKPQPHYPFPFWQMDALDFIRRYGPLADVIHASPPCQGYSSSVRSENSQWGYYSDGKATPRLIIPVRNAILNTGKPYVIENTRGSQSELHASLMLCGSMFGDMPSRHRYFEVSHMVAQPPHAPCRGHNQRLAARLGVEARDVTVAGKSRRTGSLDTWRKVMGCEWMVTGPELVESIPPAFTQYIGEQIMRVVRPKQQAITA